MSKCIQSTRSRPPTPGVWHRFTHGRAFPVLASFLATLLSLPVSAVTIPDVPLPSGQSYPPANIMFVLDDSGSMAWDFMPGAFGSGEVPATTPVAIQLNAFTRNTIHYNPNTDYLPWIQADGTRTVGGTSYFSAYDHNSALSNPINLAGSTRTFYAPKPAATDLADSREYYRYQIRFVGGLLKMVRSESGGAAAGSSGSWNNVDVNNGTWAYFPVVVPAGASQFEVRTNNKSTAHLYLRLGANPTLGSYDCRDNTGNAKTCTVASPGAGIWNIGIYASGNVNNVDIDYTIDVGLSGAGCDATWKNCTFVTPTGRLEADELTNYATWYSYHRTRSKLAKAGASEAFAQLGTNVRVGYDSIWNRVPYQIPVGSNAGEFSGTNKSDWFQRMQGAIASGGTPLKGALQRTGNYYRTNTGAAGPWGPEAGAAQLTCRQNFAILTTDGYWNSTSGFTPVGDTDGTGGPTHTNATSTYTYTPSRPYVDGPPTQSDTLADVAMDFWKRDLRPTMSNNVPVNTADPAFWQHMVTFGVSIGQQGRLSPAAGDLNAIISGAKSWGNPNDAEDADRIDDLWHAAVNGRGTFVAASNPAEFATALSDALNTIQERGASVSNVAANSTSFITDTRIYQASYVAGRWSGELASYVVTSSGVNTATDAFGVPIGGWLASRNIPVPAARKIFTWNGVTGMTFPTPLQTIGLSRPLGVAPATGLQNVAYIKGDRSLERQNGGLLRNRTTVLGDIAHSSPFYAKEIQTIFVGANDGMLHAFNATNGVELFAYVPGGINLPDLASLSDPYYGHKYFVDGPVVVSAQSQTPGKNYLVAALGRGGKGLFGLDVSNPAGFTASDAKWELTTGANMGEILGQPLVVKLNNGAQGVITSNGINSTSGKAVLYVINIATGAVIREIDTGVAGDNGLSAPRGWDADGNGTVDYVYAGDLKGNVWKFNLSGGGTASWVVANSGAPMFVAKDGGGTRQPITAGLGLASEPGTGKLWILFGTGSYQTTADVASVSTQSMYGLIDDNTVITGRAQLQMRSIVVSGTFGGRPVRSFEAEGPLNPGVKGWYLDLGVPTPGERIVSDPRVLGRVFITSSIIPDSDACNAAGSGFINAMDAFTGASLSSESYFDVDGDGDFSNDVLDDNGNPLPIGSVDLGVGMPSRPILIDNLLVVGGSTGTTAAIGVQPPPQRPRRVSWDEIRGN